MCFVDLFWIFENHHSNYKVICTDHTSLRRRQSLNKAKVIKHLNIICDSTNGGNTKEHLPITTLTVLQNIIIIYTCLLLCLNAPPPLLKLDMKTIKTYSQILIISYLSIYSIYWWRGWSKKCILNMKNLNGRTQTKQIVKW